jgi:hypothetical protein
MREARIIVIDNIENSDGEEDRMPKEAFEHYI